MKYLDLTLPTPAENLAGDEALLDACEEDGAAEVLRFWESPMPFVVVGYGNRVATEVREDACRAAGVPVRRRCSGGGTVLQGPGCLNYTLVLRIDDARPLASIPAANRFIMEQHRQAIQKLTPRVVRVEGCTDLTLDGLKVSGNAQRRKRTHLLFHGTFLLHFDLAHIERFLPLPTRQPDYRGGRSHGEFLANIGLEPSVVRDALRAAWRAGEPSDEVPFQRIAGLVKARYSREEWNLKV
jgi:lipoate-protein ligase A